MVIKEKKRRSTVICPVCLEEFETDIYRVITVSDLKSFKIDSINQATCPHCGAVFRIAERILVHYLPEDVIFFVYPDPEEDERLVRTAFREIKSVLKDLEVDVPDMIMVLGWERFVVFWELLKRKDLQEYFFDKGRSYQGKSYFYIKLEQLAGIFLEYIDMLDDINRKDVLEEVKKRFESIVDI